MTTYLQMNGTSDYLQIPSITFDKIEMVINLSNTQPHSSNFYVLDARPGYSNGYFFNGSSPGWTVTQNGVTMNQNAGSLTKGTKITVDLVPTPATSYTSTITVFDRYTSNPYAPTAGNIYDIKVFLGGVVQAHYDMSTGTVNDQTGNGYNATLTGGTWVTSGTSGTVESVSFDTKLRIHAQETVSFDSKQKIYTTESVSFDTKQSIYIQETLSFDTKQIVYIHESTKFDAKQVIYMLETTSFDMTQRIYATETVNFDTKQRVYTVESISFDTKQKIDSASSFEIVIFDTKQALYASESVKIPTRQQIRDRFYYVTTIGR